MPFLLHLSLEGITDVDADPKGRFVSSNVTPSNQKSLFVSLQGMAPEKSWLEAGGGGGGGTLYKNKNEGNENKIMLGYLNCTMFKIDRDGENKT